MKKSNAILTILTVSFCLSTGICTAQTAVVTAGQPQKKEQQVKIVIKKDGKIIEKDTTFVTNDGKGVIVSDKDIIYKGDSIIIAKDGKGKQQTVTVIVNDEKGNASKSKKAGAYTYTYTSGDSVNKNVTHKMIRSDDGNQMIIMQSGDSENFDLPAPQSSGHAYKMMVRQRCDPFAFDPTDTTIVSYNKKDMGKGLEKITIVRKKALEVGK